MREYKFRGFCPCVNRKEKVYINGERITGEWIYGDLTVLGSCYFISGYMEHLKTVIPETVGQYTGLTDKNGKEIYEGDIFLYDCRYVKDKSYGVIVHRNTYESYRTHNTFGFVMEWKNKIMHLREDLPYWIIVDNGSINLIGNIHANPELVE